MARKSSSQIKRVITPGGPRPVKNIQRLRPNEVIQQNKDRTFSVVPRPPDMSKAMGAEKMVYTPGGPRPASQFQRLGPNQKIDLRGDQIRIVGSKGELIQELGKLERKPRMMMEKQPFLPPADSNWITYSYWGDDTGDAVSLFVTQWRVPPPPATPDQLIYLFNSVYPQSNTWILQPVLQYGYVDIEQMATDSGHFWVAACWWVPTDTTKKIIISQDVVRVNPGDVLKGVITLSQIPTGMFSYDCEFQNFRGQYNTLIHVDLGEPILYCSETLEAYYPKTVYQYPNADLTAMTDIEIETVRSATDGSLVTNFPPLNWNIINRIQDVGQHTLLVNNSNPGGEVDIYYSASPTNLFTPVYDQGDPGQGIGTYDLRSLADRGFAFDYDHSGMRDHLVFYRPGTGIIYIIKNSGGTFSPVFASGQGIGGYDLKLSDRAFAFDFEHSGKMDHLVLYRPSTGIIWILKNTNGNFERVYPLGNPVPSGIGGFDLLSPTDRVFAFDYDHSGMLDYLGIYRPGTGTIWILRNSGGSFSPVYHEGDPGNGIGGYSLSSTADRVCAFDYNGSGRYDHLVLYRPGAGTVWILQNSNGNFSPIYQQGDPTNTLPGIGIGGYDLKSSADRIFPFDFDSIGTRNYLTLIRPGAGTIWFIRNNEGSFTPVYKQGDPGRGIGTYDLLSTADRAFAFDYDQSGDLDHLVIYRPGTGAIMILRKT